MNRLALACLLLLLPGSGLAAEVEDAVERGDFLFKVHCRSCHGDSAGGDGPMAEVLRVRPADLTRLAESSDGKFDPELVYRKIDGREEVRGHGSSDMPIWGLSFQSAGRDDAQEREVRERIEDLVAYLATVQIGSARTDVDQR